jgi:hypothetical protein
VKIDRVIVATAVSWLGRFNVPGRPEFVGRKWYLLSRFHRCHLGMIRNLCVGVDHALAYLAP